MTLGRVGAAILAGTISLTALDAADAGVEPVARREVRVRVAWRYQNIPAGMRIYEPSPGRPLKLWQMGSAASASELPVGNEIAGGRFSLEAGAEKTFLLVYRNDTDHPVRFFAAPHSVHPAEHALGFEFQCLCVNHIYTAPPRGYWYRVVKLSLDSRARGPLAVTHVLVRAAEEQTSFGF